MQLSRHEDDQNPSKQILVKIFEFQKGNLDKGSEKLNFGMQAFTAREDKEIMQYMGRWKSSIKLSEGGLGILRAVKKSGEG